MKHSLIFSTDYNHMLDIFKVSLRLDDKKTTPQAKFTPSEYT